MTSESLKKKLTSLAPLTDDEWATFAEILQPTRFAKQEVALQAGQVCPGIHFVLEGALRTFHLKDGREIHTAFHFEEDFAQDVESLSQGVPARVNIVALEDTKTLFIPKGKLLALYEESPTFQRLGREILSLIAISEKRYATLFTDYLPKERYEYVVTQHPELIQRVPLQYLASFLGIARETLSRIRKRIQ